MALGPYPLISLALAREKQADIRRLILEGINPAEKRREEKWGGANLFNTFESVALEWGASNVNWFRKCSAVCKNAPIFHHPVAAC